MPGLLFSLLPPGARDPVSTGSGNQDTDNDYDDDDNDDFQVIGSLEQQWSFCQPRFLVKDERGEAILSIEGPGIVCDCCSDIDFNIMSLVNESEVRDEYRHCLDFFDFFLFRLEKLQNNGQESDGKCSRTHKTSE